MPLQRSTTPTLAPPGPCSWWGMSPHCLTTPRHAVSVVNLGLNCGTCSSANVVPLWRAIWRFFLRCRLSTTSHQNGCPPHPIRLAQIAPTFSTFSADILIQSRASLLATGWPSIEGDLHFVERRSLSTPSVQFATPTRSHNLPPATYPAKRKIMPSPDPLRWAQNLG